MYCLCKDKWLNSSSIALVNDTVCRFQYMHIISHTGVARNTKGGLRTELEVCDKMLNHPALLAALLNDELIVKAFPLSNLKTSVGFLVPDCLALKGFDREKKVQHTINTAVLLVACHPGMTTAATLVLFYC